MGAARRGGSVTSSPALRTDSWARAPITHHLPPRSQPDRAFLRPAGGSEILDSVAPIIWEIVANGKYGFSGINYHTPNVPEFQAESEGSDPPVSGCHDGLIFVFNRRAISAKIERSDDSIGRK